MYCNIVWSSALFDDWCQICDLVIAFDCYIPSDLTARAKEIAKDSSSSCGILQVGLFVCALFGAT